MAITIGLIILFVAAFIRRQYFRSWLGLLNHDGLQWTGFRLAYLLDEETGQKTNWQFIKFKPGKGWVRR